MKNYTEYKRIVLELMNSTFEDYSRVINKGLVIELEYNTNGENYRFLTEEEFLKKINSLPQSRIDGITFSEILKKKILPKTTHDAINWWNTLTTEEKTIKQIQFGGIHCDKTIYDLTNNEIELIFNYSIFY
jgi:hypothetical protein